MQALQEIDPYSVESLGTKKDDSTEISLYQIVPQSLQERLDSFRNSTAPAVASPTWILSYSQLDTETLIGSGSFGSVYAAKYKGQQVVLKQFMKQKYTDAAGVLMRAESAKLRYESRFFLLPFTNFLAANLSTRMLLSSTD